MEIREQSSRKRRKQNGLSVDRISDLPESVLCHILSFLNSGIRRHQYFIYIMKVNTFRLNYGIHCNPYQIDTWVTFAVDRSVENIDLYLRFHVDLPRCLFACKTLFDLSLENCGLIPNIGTVVYFPSLKNLRLSHVRYDGDESLSHLLSSCPVLEELVIRLCIDYCSCKISSPTIKRLMVNLLFDGEPEDNQDYNKLEINTPAIVYLQLLDCTKQYIKCGVLTSLAEADVEIYNGIKPQDGFPYSRSLVGFFDRLSNVKCLKLDLSDCTEIIDSVLSAWTIRFRNLTKLELASNCCFLMKFLENADKLEILILNEVHEEMTGWMEPQQVPACLSSHLRTIKLVGIKGEKQELEIIRYLLRNAQVLERVQIFHPSSRNSVENMFTMYKLKEIPSFERGSKACEVAFVSN